MDAATAVDTPVTVFAVVALLGVLVTVLSLVVLHVVPTGLNPVSAAVSQYGISRYRAGYRVATIALGVAAIALGVALTMAIEPPNVIGLVFLLLFGLARLVISWAPMDAPGAARTGTGRAHNVLATIFFASATVAAFLYTGSFADDPSLASIAVASSVLSWVLAATSALTILASVVRPLKPSFGLAERLLYLAVFAWLILVATTLLTAA